MADYDLVLRGGDVCFEDRTTTADLAVTDGLISGIGPELRGGGREELDARGLLVVAGGVDPHVHFNAPGRTEWEGWESGSRALLAGGFTACLEMPLNSLPVTTDPDAFDAKRAVAEGTSLVDFGLFGGLVPGNLHQLEPLAGRGVVGFKAFLCDSGLPEFPPADDLTLSEGMRRCAELDSIVLVHAENEAIVAGLAGRAAAGPSAARDYSTSRPVAAELEAITRALFWTGETGCRLHVVHVSTARGVLLVEEARRAGVDVSCETCPHYLLLDERDLERAGAVAKCAPPLRPAAEREALWRLLEEGRLEILASDHSPCAPERKAGDLLHAWGGISGCQTTRQLLWAEGTGRGVGVPRLAALTGTAAARRFRLSGKGRIEVGSDADLCLVDLSAEWRLQASELRYRHPVTPFLGRRLRGRIVRAMLRGRTVLVGGEYVSGPCGRLLTPAAA